MKKKINIIIGLTLSVFFVYLAFRKVNFGEIIFSLKNANYLLILPNMALVVLTMYIRAERWQYLLNPIKKFRSQGFVSFGNDWFYGQQCFAGQARRGRARLFIGSKERRITIGDFCLSSY